MQWQWELLFYGNKMDLKEILKQEPSFRKEQVEKAIFQDLIIDWEKALNLPKTLREKLEKQLPLDIKADVLVSKKGNSQKAVIRFSDGLVVEAVLMQHPSRNTVCVSSQVGCSMGCLFCLTGQGGFKRNLSVFEIISQVLFFERLLKIQNQKVTNVVFMGMGEPLLNYDNVMKAVEILNKPTCFGISRSKISISTAGIPLAIKKLAKETLKPNLAVSLHSANQAKRASLMPITKENSLNELATAVGFYIKQTGQRVMFEYLMLRGVNDTEKDALELSLFIKQFKAPVNFRVGKNFYFVNLIAFNDFKSQNQSSFKPSYNEVIAKFKEILAKNGIDSSQRYKFGKDIKGACGQLVYEK